MGGLVLYRWAGSIWVCWFYIGGLILHGWAGSLKVLCCPLCAGVLLVLTAAMEFNSKVSPLLPSRPSDDVELTRILTSKSLPHIVVKPKEKFLGTPYAIKAQLLLHTHMERVPLHSNLLLAGQTASSQCSLVDCLLVVFFHFRSASSP